MPTVEPLFISKYKPYYINDFCTSDQFKNVLHSLIEIDDVNILVSGGTCTGKTSLLHAIIRNYYGIQKTQTFPENNILFINNLKEQGISYFRSEMKTFSQSRCSIYGKKKLVIVDDLDMVNEQCQQVFRNYIDKYKSNINFVSVCSNVQKVIESIQSRVHILHIDKPSIDQIRSIMQRIIKQENLCLSLDAQNYLLHTCDYSIRELITMLEKIWILVDSSQNVDLEQCSKIISTISSKHFENYITCLQNNQLVEAIHVMHGIYEYGYSVIDIFDFFFSYVKSSSLLTETEKYRLIPSLCEYITYFHNIHEDEIELALFTYTIFPMFKRIA
jgi:DNA polymerase III delta prime subunit